MNVRRLALRFSHVVTVVPFMLSTAVLVSCREKQAEMASPIVVHEYVVRGLVSQLPDAANPTMDFVVQHEAIPEFKGPGGHLGMNTMKMPFPLAKDLSLSGISVGDKVEMTFVVDFDTQKDSPVGYRATKVTKLPAETPLDFTPLPEQPAATEAQPTQN